MWRSHIYALWISKQGAIKAAPATYADRKNVKSATLVVPRLNVNDSGGSGNWECRAMGMLQLSALSSSLHARFITWLRILCTPMVTGQDSLPKTDIRGPSRMSLADSSTLDPRQGAIACAGTTPFSAIIKQHAYTLLVSKALEQRVPETKSYICEVC